MVALAIGCGGSPPLSSSSPRQGPSKAEAEPAGQSLAPRPPASSDPGEDIAEDEDSWVESSEDELDDVDSDEDDVAEDEDSTDEDAGDDLLDGDEGHEEETFEIDDADEDWD